MVKETVKRVWSLNFNTVFIHLDLPGPSGKGDDLVDSIEEIRKLLFTDILSRTKKYYE